MLFLHTCGTLNSIISHQRSRGVAAATAWHNQIKTHCAAAYVNVVCSSKRRRMREARRIRNNFNSRSRRIRRTALNVASVRLSSRMPTMSKGRIEMMSIVSHVLRAGVESVSPCRHRGHDDTFMQVRVRAAPRRAHEPRISTKYFGLVDHKHTVRVGAVRH